MSRTLLLVDFSNLVYRAFHTPGAELVTREGEVVKVPFLLLSMTLKLAEAAGATHAVFALDAQGGSFRDELFAGYKEGRPPMPDGLAAQLRRTGECLVRLGFPWHRSEGFEADDLLATLARQAPAAGFERAVIATADRDLLGAVDATTDLLSPHQGIDRLVRYSVGEDGMIAARPEAAWKYAAALTPAQFTDYKALVGDGSDHFPGCPGIGPKTAATLLVRFGSLEGIYGAIAEVTPAGVRAKLEAGETSARLCQRLATLRTDAPVTLDPERGAIAAAATPAPLAFLASLGMRRIIERLEEWA